MFEDDNPRHGPNTCSFTVSIPVEVLGRIVPEFKQKCQFKVMGELILLCIFIEAATGFAPQPAGFHIFAQERTGPVLGIAETMKQSLHDG
jgi:hypothetical protein